MAMNKTCVINLIMTGKSLLLKRMQFFFSTNCFFVDATLFDCPFDGYDVPVTLYNPIIS
jgi:hypothetical protein